MSRAVEPVLKTQAKTARFQQLLAQAQSRLREAEAELAQEQAQVNAFRMHCRLKLDLLVETLLELHAQKQACLTRLALLQQAQELGLPYADDDPLGFEAFHEEIEAEEDEEAAWLLPTPTPNDKAAEKRLYRELARRFHPDLSRTAVERSYRTTMMAAINSAYAARDMQALYDLAGELEPAEVAELAGIESPEVRRLRTSILKCRRLRRKARHQLQALREENTARLWQRAQQMDANESDYWTLLRGQLEAAIATRRPEVEALQQRLETLEKNRA